MSKALSKILSDALDVAGVVETKLEWRRESAQCYRAKGRSGVHKGHEWEVSHSGGGWWYSTLILIDSNNNREESIRGPFGSRFAAIEAAEAREAKIADALRQPTTD